MTITTNDVRDEYTASAAQTVFNYTFKIFADGQLNVYITPSGQEPNDSTDITTAYTIDPSSIGDEDGGFLTLDSGTSNGDLVTIVSNIPEARTTDYQNSGDFLPDTVNADFDTVVSLVKQVEDKTNRTLAFQNSLQNATALTLPAPSAGLFMVWNGTETGLENTGVPSVIVPGDLSGTLTALKSATNLTIGDFVVTTGYNANGDSGDNTYEIVAAATGTDDGGSFIDLAGSGLQAKGLFPGGEVRVAQFGGNLDAALAIRAVELGTETIGVSSAVSISTTRNLTGQGVSQSIIDASTVGEALTLTGAAHSNFSDFTMSSDVWSDGISGGGSNLTFDKVRFLNLTTAIEITEDAFWSNFYSCVFRNCENGIVSTGVTQDFNSTAFYSCKWQDSFADDAHRAVNFSDEEGISFYGCSFEQMSAEFTDCRGINFSGGYYESPNRPVVILNNTGATFNGVHFLPGTLVNIDDDSYRMITGNTVPCTSNTNYGPAPSIEGSENIFPNPLCNDDTALAGFNLTGFTSTINGSSEVEFNTTVENDVVTIQLPDTSASGLSVLVRMQVTAGDIRVRLQETDVVSATVIEIADNEVVIRMWSKSTPGTDQPFIEFRAQNTFGAYSFVIRECYVVPHWGAICDPAALSFSSSDVLGIRRSFHGSETDIAASGTFDVPLFEFIGQITVISEDVASFNTNYTKSIIHLEKQGTGSFNAVVQNSFDGSGGSRTFTITNVDSTTIRFTNTSASTTRITWTATGMPG